jgi:hypothetical protein
VFCPNCGTQNDDSAVACQKCAFNLKGAAVPKFKGTMLMVNAPPNAPKPAGAGRGLPSATRPLTPTPAPAPGVRSPAAVGQKSQMKATMIGVAPPSAGGIAPPPAPAPAAQQQTAAAFAMPPQQPAPVRAPEDVSFAGGTAVLPAAVPKPATREPVNPLGGTMIAEPGGAGYVPAYQQSLPEPAAQGQISAPLGVTTPSGHTPNELAAGAAVQGSAWAAPIAAAPTPGAWGQPEPPPQPAAPSPAAMSPVAWGAPEPAQPAAPGPAAYSPYGAPQNPMGGAAQGIQPAPAPGLAYGSPATLSGQHGQIGKMRNPILVVVLTYVTCGFYGIFALLSMLGELKTFRQKNDISPILFFIPIVGILEMIKLPAKVLDAKRMAGVPNAQEPNAILYLLLWFYMLPADLNEVWQVASARQGYGAVPPSSV